MRGVKNERAREEVMEGWRESLDARGGRGGGGGGGGAERGGPQEEEAITLYEATKRKLDKFVLILSAAISSTQTCTPKHYMRLHESQKVPAADGTQAQRPCPGVCKCASPRAQQPSAPPL